jgi:GNAT superfamily N-acetyltransferase
VIRLARPDDVPTLLELVRALADYERSADEVELTGELLHAALFGPDPSAGCHVAERAPGELAGFALWFRTFSTWTGVPGMWLEDLFVRPDDRGAGHGRALLAALARHCVDSGWRRLDWAVLDWNTPAIGFYRALGAAPQDDWTTYRVTGATLESLAGSVSASQV